MTDTTTSSDASQRARHPQAWAGGPPRVLLATSDRAVGRELGAVMEEAGLRTEPVSDAGRALAIAVEGRHDLLVLDADLRGTADLDVIEAVGRLGRPAVVVFTPRARDTVALLDAGADDVLARPFSPLELRARVSAVLRRLRPPPPPTIEVGDLVVDLAGRAATRAGRRVTLARREFELLAFLAAAPRRPFTREELLAAVWGGAEEWRDPATVTEHVHRLRRKIEADPAHPRWILAVRGVGYRFGG